MNGRPGIIIGWFPLRLVDFFSRNQDRSRSRVKPVDEPKKASILRWRFVDEPPSYEIAICDTTGFVQSKASGSPVGRLS